MMKIARSWGMTEAKALCDKHPMTAPDGFRGEWFRTRPRGFAAFLIGPLFMWLFFRNNGIGITEDGVTLRGFSTKHFPWDDIETIRSTRGGALIKASELVSKQHGVLAMPIHHADDAQRLISLLAERGKIAQLTA